ncbi:unnamed protein product, partial [Mesorhabditis belari]|uniref:Uncharacterized protein n=1 Tax=Mesorhabditis belari TaxID=2138241 RepID=A0AAF3EB13_9BILA
MRGARNRGYEVDESDAGPSCDYPLPYCTIHAHHNESNTPRTHLTPVPPRIQTLNAANLRLSNAQRLQNPTNRYSQPPSYPAACIDSPPAYTPYPAFDDFRYQQYQREPRFIRPNQAAAVHHHRRHRRSAYGNFSRSFWRKKKVMYTAIVMFIVVPVALIFIIMAGVGVF